MATKSANKKTLIDGCGNILKNNRLKGGYKLVKRKKAIGATAESEKESAPKKKAGRPKKAKMVASAPATAPKKKAGRPKKAKMMASAPATAPIKKSRGKRKATAKA
jgi:hypothetical protein